ncbi:fimbrial chaperone protein [Cupriavidus sp. OV038]|jgi:fimbrial chaperone protein|uniref:fimbrial biogenesis chaperone n=1 Tax=unclassified Cupriavidus TaxID=2640874 RepID=UPI0008DF513D|nr:MULTISPECIES: fimbria/pilus periplasmic chaperone [unclassified Cupriavidus]SFC85544.1 fimbrial chaperone protein [Cupriavidus sp. OV038]SFO80993.1 fimbrial chaperone protein [Cupriavidus sp. OV096]
MTRTLLATFALLLAMPFANAATIHVKPTMTLIPPGQSAAVITLTNQGDTPLNAQVRLFGWDQVGGEDALSPTNRLVASPPMLTLAPRQTQSIRLVRTEKSPATQVEAYRVLVDEVLDSSQPRPTGVTLQMRYSLPVFVLPREKLKPAQVTVTASADGNLVKLGAVNRGESHAQATDVSLVYRGGGTSPVVPGLLGYVLPGKSIEWRLPLPADAAAKGRPTRVKMMINGREMLVDL